MSFPLPFVLLALAIVLVWVPTWRIGDVALPPWTLAFVAACIAGVVAVPRVLDPPAIAALIGLAALAGWTTVAPRRRGAIMTLAALFALLISVHLLPGFHAPVLFSGERLTPDAARFVLALNFDKGAAGLLLLAAFCARARSWREFASQVPAIALAAVATAAVSIGIALAAGYVRFEPKWNAEAPDFLLVNLFFTCVGEEAFSRGMIQEGLMRLADRRPQRAWTWLAVAASTLLFGLAHAGGGAIWTLVATIAGLGYALIYARTRTIEGAILVHFTLNAAHFLVFTYPRLGH
jgi:membrane protease YdiL (CAAX protease family)